MKLFRIALISTGIGAIVVGIGLLIANFDKLAAGVMWAREKFEKLGTGAKILISVMFPIIGIIHGTIKALEYFGVVDDAQTAKAKKNAQEHTEAVPLSSFTPPEAAISVSSLSSPTTFFFFFSFSSA